MMARVHIVLLLGLLVCTARAQDPLVEALRSYQEGRLGAARALIDEAIEMPNHTEDAEAWLLRGFVYKDIYKAQPSSPEADALREAALQSLMQCIAFDGDGLYRQNAAQAYDFVTRSFYNDAAGALQRFEEDQATEKFERYRNAVLQMDPSADIRDREIDFTNALGTSYTRRFNLDREDIVWFDKAVDTYRSVLRMDSMNYGANYNLATLYYNRGVYNIQKIEPENDIPTIQEIQRVSKEFFLQALPYMLRAHEMRPDRRETLLGLEGIYYSLQDHTRSEEYRMRFEELPPDGDK